MLFFWFLACSGYGLDIFLIYSILWTCRSLVFAAKADISHLWIYIKSFSNVCFCSVHLKHHIALLSLRLLSRSCPSCPSVRSQSRQQLTLGQPCYPSGGPSQHRHRSLAGSHGKDCIWVQSSLADLPQHTAAATAADKTHHGRHGHVKLLVIFTCHSTAVAQVLISRPHSDRRGEIEENIPNTLSEVLEGTWDKRSGNVPRYCSCLLALEPRL